MATDRQHIVYLLERYSNGQATSTEVNQLLTLLRTEDHDETVVSFIETRLRTFEPDNTEDIAFWKNRLQGGAQLITGATITETDTVVNMPLQARPVHRVHFLRKWGWAAASIILALSLGVYLFTTSTKKTLPHANVVRAADIAPGKNGAVLTLADGSRVVLDSLGNGVVADQTGAQVILQNGKLVYKALPIADSRLTYNTMSTPKGRQFQVTLPDGTKVWLNAASSLRYPTVFTGGERKVEVNGEAYFEVAHNAQMPFKVNVNNKAEVTVLGTHFNINAYENEKLIHTTLLQGSVKIGSRQPALGSGNSLILKPGEQAIVIASPRPDDSNGRTLTINHSPDIDQVMSWKNGLFNFEGASLGEIMRQVERWYDIEIAYEKGIPNVEFEGKMTRDVPLGDLLTMLEKSDIHFRMEGRKLIVLP